jgi:HPt (histidine-containing phosphotransfer) domain-containing protein
LHPNSALMANLHPPVATGPRAAGTPADIAALGGLLDAQALARLQDLDPHGHAGLVQRVLATYTLSLQRLLDQLTVARTAGDCDGMRHAAHTLKSSSASVGALELSALCAQVEAGLRAGHAGESAALAPVLDRLSREGQRILTGLGGR